MSTSVLPASAVRVRSPTDGGQSMRQQSQALRPWARWCSRTAEPLRASAAIRSTSRTLRLPGRIERFVALVATTDSESGRSETSGCVEAGATPKPVVALHCGSRSTRSVRSPPFAMPAARLEAVVVLPTPPF